MSKENVTFFKLHDIVKNFYWSIYYETYTWCQNELSSCRATVVSVDLRRYDVHPN